MIDVCSVLEDVMIKVRLSIMKMTWPAKLGLRKRGAGIDE